MAADTTTSAPRGAIGNHNGLGPATNAANLTFSAAADFFFFEVVLLMLWPAPTLRNTGGTVASAFNGGGHIFETEKNVCR